MLSDCTAASKSGEGSETKKQRLPGQEAAAGRTGGAGKRRIVYDDAAIDALLDRSDMVTGQVGVCETSCAISIVIEASCSVAGYVDRGTLSARGAVY